jgi:hypothetical protein
MDDTNSWKSRTLIIGCIIGAIAGLGAAYIMVRRAEEAQTKPQLTTGDGVKIGMGLAGVFKLISDLGTGK